jgi:hypothetical protein
MLATLLHDTSIALNVSQQGIHTREYNNPGLVSSPRTRRCGLQSPNGTITPAGATLPCKAWSFSEGFKLEHHACE